MTQPTQRATPYKRTK